MAVTSASPHHHQHEGRSYFFCRDGCRAKFAADPAKYVAPATSAPAPAQAGTIYVCPMHPEIRRDEHGEVTPADKLVLVERLQKEGRVVAMAGDGINDAPAGHEPELHVRRDQRPAA